MAETTRVRWWSARDTGRRGTVGRAKDFHPMEVLQDPRAIDLPADDQLWRALLEPVREECFAALRDQSPGWSVPELLADGITFSQCVKEGQSLGMARASCVIGTRTEKGGKKAVLTPPRRIARRGAGVPGHH